MQYQVSAPNQGPCEDFLECSAEFCNEVEFCKSGSVVGGRHAVARSEWSDDDVSSRIRMLFTFHGLWCTHIPNVCSLTCTDRYRDGRSDGADAGGSRLVSVTVSARQTLLHTYTLPYLTLHSVHHAIHSTSTMPSITFHLPRRVAHPGQQRWSFARESGSQEQTRLRHLRAPLHPG